MSDTRKCRWCDTIVEPCGATGHQDVCHSHALNVGDYWAKCMERTAKA